MDCEENMIYWVHSALWAEAPVRAHFRAPVIIFFFNQNFIQMASEYQNMTLRIDKNAPQSFKDPSIQLKDGWILDFCDDMFSKVVLTKVSSNYAIRWPNDSKWSWRLSCPQWFQSENSGTCAILTRSHRLVQVWEEFLDEILMS